MKIVFIKLYVLKYLNFYASFEVLGDIKEI
jgi:hypothetical protein